MAFQTRAANDCEPDAQHGVTIGLLTGAIMAGLGFARSEDGVTIYLGGLMTMGASEDAPAQKRA